MAMPHSGKPGGRMRLDCQAVDLRTGASALGCQRSEMRRGAVEEPCSLHRAGHTVAQWPAASFGSMRRDSDPKRSDARSVCYNKSILPVGPGAFPRRRVEAIQGGDMFQKTSRLHAWIVVAMLFLFMVINFADKAVIGLAAVPIMHDLGLRLSSSGSSAGVSSCCSPFPDSCSGSRPRVSKPGGCWRSCRSYGQSHSFRSSEP